VPERRLGCAPLGAHMRYVPLTALLLQASAILQPVVTGYFAGHFETRLAYNTHSPYYAQKEE